MVRFVWFRPLLLMKVKDESSKKGYPHTFINVPSIKRTEMN